MNLDCAKYWDRVALEWSKKDDCNRLLAEHKRRTHLALLKRWAEISPNWRILKTDLFEEALNNEQFSFDLAQNNCQIFGIDVSSNIAWLARANALAHGVNGGYLCGDVRELPFQNGSFDLVISNSTLDHFPDTESIVRALNELFRIIRTGGTLIITLDNKAHLTYPPYFIIRLWMKLGLAPYFIGKTLSLKELVYALSESGFAIKETTAIFHYPHPDVLTRGLETFLSWIGKGKLDSTIKKSLVLLDRLEHKKTRYLTGRYIAVKAVKM
jgi:SAM-dependent methyltransferase